MKKISKIHSLSQLEAIEHPCVIIACGENAGTIYQIISRIEFVLQGSSILIIIGCLDKALEYHLEYAVLGLDKHVTTMNCDNLRDAVSAAREWDNRSAKSIAFIDLHS